MPDRDSQQAGVLDTVHGATLSVHQDHDGVRIDAGFLEFTFNREQAAAMREAIGTAMYLAACWEADNADA